MYFSTVFILLLTLLDILVYYLRKKKEEGDVDQKNTPPSPSSLDHKHCRVFSLSEIKLATHDFDEAFVIGKGGFGKVYKGKFDFVEGNDVAIKRSNLESNQGAAEFWAEIEMLSKLRHTHIVSLLGYCFESSTREMILVYEYMPNGSLDDHLHTRKIKKRNNSNSSLTWVQRVNICIGAARGLDYLHTGTSVQIRVIHRDIKSSNILLDENWAAKISDFGVSRTSPAYHSGATTDVYTRQIIGTFGYLDAEYFSTHRVTRKSDVYAFGVVLLEVLCGRPALDFTLDEQQHSLAGWAKHCIREGNVSWIIDPVLRGQAPSNCLKEFGQIAYECLHSCSKSRPTMTKVLARLENVLAWTLRSVESGRDRRHIGKTVLIEKAWSLFSIKAPNRINPETKILGQSDGNKKKGIATEKGATAVAESGGDSGGVATASQQVVPSGETTPPPNLKEFTMSKLKLATKNFRNDMVIGEGGFGRVYIGWVDSATYEPKKPGSGLAVAIKRLKPESAQGHREWLAEMLLLGSLRHPNLVELLGYCSESRDYFLVYEYMKKGSLDRHLFNKSSEPLPWHTRIKIAIGAAEGLAFLHHPNNNVICRDMKASNILLDEDFNVKISDFGLAREGANNGSTHVSTMVVGTKGYMAPEYITTGRLYIKSDVYAFGMVMLEIITGLQARDARQHGIDRKLHKQSLEKIMDPRLEHDYPSKDATKIIEIIQNCIQKDHKNRPSMEEVVSSLHTINATEMEPGHSKSKSKSKTNSRDPSQQNQHWSHIGTSKGKGASSSRSWLSGVKRLIGSKKDQTTTEIWRK